MRFLILSFFLLFSPLAQGAKTMSIYDFKVKNIDGKDTSLSSYKGKALLIVNTASECGFTPQYAGLEKIYQKYKAQGFEVLGFPSNDFGGQEPGSEAEIKKFCELKYKTTFPMFSKVKVKEAETGSLYAYLQAQKGEGVKWNFGKFLVSKDGQVIDYYSSNTTPESEKLTAAIEKALAK